MSLAILADHMASKGRGPDSMLVHMAPSEVQGLQALAVRHGGSLTINPETGLPEAGFLSKLLPMIIGAALAPLTAGTSLAFLGATPFASALTVGGFEALRTGDIGKGISAGLGAYGGASLGANLASSGAQSLGAEATNAAAVDAGALAANEAGRIGMEQGLSGEALEAFKAQAVDSASLASPSVAANATSGELMSEGLKQAKANPMEFLKANAKPLMYTAAPLLAGDEAKSNMPTTVTKPGMIAPYSFDPYSGRYVAGNPYEAMPTRAADGGLMGMADGGYNPGQLDFVQRSEPVARMASGGIAALAAGGPSYIDLSKDSSADQIASAYKAFTDAEGGNTQKNQAAAIDYLTNLGVGQDKINEAYGKYQAGPTYTNYTAQNVTDYLQANPNTDLAAATTQFNVDPRTVNQAISQIGAGFLDPTQTAGGSGSAQYYDAFSKYGIDADELFAANKALNPDYSFAGDTTAGQLNRAFETAKDFKGFDPVGSSQAIKDVEWVKKMDIEGANAVDIARLTGLSIGEVKAREAAARLLMKTKIGTGGLTTVPILPGGGLGVSGGGNTVVNPNGTVTTTPDIPGRPADGFTGMGQVKDAYTQGGGSLGYTPYTPKTIEEFNDKYTSRLTGGSKQSYDYLTGKTPYSPVPYTPTGEVQKPYAEAVLGIPTAASTRQYLFDPATRQYKVNPDYAIPTRDSKGKVSYALTNKDVAEYVGTKPTDDAFLDWANTNNLSAEQIAAATGMPISEVYKRLKKGKPVEKKEVANTTNDATSAKKGGVMRMALGGLGALAGGGQAGYNLGGYSDGGRLLRGPGDGVSDSIPATIGNKRPARLADGEFVVPARIVSELGNGSTEAGARKLYAMMDRVQAARRGTVGKKKVAKNSRADKYLPA